MDHGTSTFDPYHKWLGIPPAEQPADAYRLLGLALYEDDAEVIAAAADRQMAHVKSFAAGPFREEAQRLLNELSRARITLLNPHHKAAYDRRVAECFRPGVLARDAIVAAPASDRIATTELSELSRLGRRASISTAQDYRRKRSRRTSGGGFILWGSIATIVACLTYAVQNRPPAPIVEVSRSDSSQVATSSAAPRINAPTDSAAGSLVDNKQLAVNGLHADKQALRVPRAAQKLPSGNYSRQREWQYRADDETSLASRPRNSARETSPTVPHIVQRLALDLTKRRQATILSEGSRTALCVAGLSNADCPYVIDPPDGALGAGDQVVVTLNGLREVLLRIHLDDGDDGQQIVNFEPVMVTAGGDEVPFVEANLNRNCRQCDKSAALISRQASALQAEATRLNVWINSPIIKPLAAVGQAKTRVVEIQAMLPGLQANFAQAQRDCEVADSLLEFAKKLHKRCQIELSTASDEERVINSR